MQKNPTESKDFILKKTLNSIEVVVDDALLSSVPVVEVYVGKIDERKHTSRLVQELNRKLPIPMLQHLKRVFRDEIILCLSSSGHPDDVLEKSAGDISGLTFKCVRKINVPSIMPTTRKQYTHASSLWPCGFHEDKYLEKLLSNTLFDHKDLQEHTEWMTLALKAAQRSRTPVGAVVVDPKNKSLVAVAGDDRESHPLKHAVMVVVDLVARTQGGGAWNKSPNDYVFQDNVVKNTVTHSKRDLEGMEKPIGPYLCTGYDVYLTREPCAMCAMAMVHSRVRRVFYGTASATGTLGTLAKIHILKGLNHHYEVFRGLLGDECCSLYNLRQKDK